MVSWKDLQRSKIAIFGTGLNAVECAYSLIGKGIEITCFLNNNKQMDMFLGCPVHEPGSDILNGVYVIIAVETMPTYVLLSKQLSQLNLEEFTDYIYYRWICKKMVLLHGNCHMEIVKSYLESSEIFRSKYAIYPNPAVCINEKKKIDTVVLKNCDVWIHEDIQKNNKYGYYLSDEYIRTQWRKEAIGNGSDRIEITIPHLFGLGKAFFPQMSWNQRNGRINNEQDRNGMFPHADLIIDQCVEKGMTLDDIILYCATDAVLDKEFVVKNFEEYMNKIKERESSWDIKIYEFIVENYQKLKLFYDAGHPSNVIMEKISKDVLNRLGVEDRDIHTDLKMDAHENPVYPAVKRWLKLEWNEQEMRKSSYGKKCRNKMDFEEYIKEYLWWTYGYRVAMYDVEHLEDELAKD